MKTNAFLFFVCSIVFLSCTKSNLSLNNNTNTNTINNNGNTLPALGGTKWVLYQYKSATMQKPLTRNDTLVFIDATNYKYNKVPCTYSINSYSLNNTMLHLYGTPFGVIGGSVAKKIRTYGEIIDVPFSQILITSGVTYSLWMKKI